MIIAHFPAGYILSTALAKRLAKNTHEFRKLVRAGLIGSVTPDFDMFYFLLIDNRQHPHHTYQPHYPVTWFVLLAAIGVWRAFSRHKATIRPYLVFAGTGLLHLVLDSVVGQIWWLYPFVDRPFSLFTVHPLYQPWWLNFLFHWTFGIEIFILILALRTWVNGGQCLTFYRCTNRLN